MSQIRKRIVQQYTAMGLSQTKLAKLIGMNQSLLSKKLRGETGLKNEEIRRLAEVLHLEEYYEYPIIRSPEAVSTECEGLFPDDRNAAMKVMDKVLQELEDTERHEFYLMFSWLCAAKQKTVEHARVFRALSGF